MNSEMMNGTIREGFGERSIERSGETNTAALAAQAQAAVQARFVVALQRPRSWDDVRVRLLRECKRPGFAEVARYSKPQGGERIEGASVRFAEACLRYAGNMGADTSVTYEDATRRTLTVTVTDYESNASYSATVTVEKIVERKNANNRAILGERLNSSGQRVFLVAATDDELLNKQAALVSKAVRTLALRLIPGDIVDEGQETCRATLEAGARNDPSEARRKLADGFASLGVLPADLERYLGHSLDALQPSEAVELRAVFAAIRDGETRWADVLATKGVGASDDEGASKAKTAIDSAKAKALAKAAELKAAKAAAKAASEAPEPAAEGSVEP
jgi:hypothetical protein